MDDTIYRQDAVREIANHLGIPAENWMKIAEEWLRDVPSAQPETHEKRTETHACVLISRQAAIDALDVLCQEHSCGAKMEDGAYGI